MATLYLQELASPNYWGDTYVLDTVAPTGTTKTAVVNTTSGGSNIQWTKTAGGAVIEWRSAPLVSGITISGTVNVSIYARESTTSVNAGGRCAVFRLSGATYTQIGVANDGVEFSATTATNYTWSITPTSTAFAVGDKVVVRMYVTNVGTMGAATSGATLSYDSSTYPTSVSLTEDPVFAQYYTNSILEENSASETPLFTQTYEDGVLNPNSATASAAGWRDYSVETPEASSAADAPAQGVIVQNNILENSPTPTDSAAQGIRITNAIAEAGAAANTQDSIKTVYAVLSNAYATGKGYFGGGQGVGATIDGLDFTSEVASIVSATLALARYDMGGAQSSTRGYFAGGNSATNEIDGIQFFGETAINPSATLRVARWGLAGVSSATRGYFGGGYTASFTSTNEIDGIIFATEAAIDPGSVLLQARYALASAESSTRGYWAGGTAASPYNVINGFRFDIEATVSVSATLVSARYFLAGVQSSSAGYFGGGSGGTNSSEIDGITFATEAATNPAATLSRARGYLAGVSSALKGYFSEGSAAYSTADAFNFATLTVSTPYASMSGGRPNTTGVQAPSTPYSEISIVDSAASGQLYSDSSTDNTANATDSLFAEVIVVQIGNQTFLIFFN